MTSIAPATPIVRSSAAADLDRVTALAHAALSDVQRIRSTYFPTQKKAA